MIHLCCVFMLLLYAFAAQKPTRFPTRFPTRSIPTRSPTLVPSTSPTFVPSSTIPTMAPTNIPPMECPEFVLTDTNMAQQNYIICSYNLTNYLMADIFVSTCNYFVGDTYLRAYVNGLEIDYNDDGCGVPAGGSTLSFTLNYKENVTIHEGYHHHINIITSISSFQYHHQYHHQYHPRLLWLDIMLRDSRI